MRIKIATKWRELSIWQQKKIAKLYMQSEKDTFFEDYVKMVSYVFRKKRGVWSYLRMRRVFAKAPFSELSKFTTFLLQFPELSEFPEIKGLIKPADRLTDMAIGQFSVCDALFHDYMKERNELNLRRFVASIYRIRPEFDKLDLSKVADITDKQKDEVWYLVALVYLSVRKHIAEMFPVVFPKKEEEQESETPVFKKKEVYIPFSKICVALSMDERQPLGNYQAARKERIYDFLNVFSETLLRHKEAAKNHKK